MSLADASRVSCVRGLDPATGRSIVAELRDARVHAVYPASHDETGWLSAGLVDLQVNGFAGHDLNGGSLTVQTVHELALAMLACGVTTFLPTLITASEVQLTQALAVIAQARREIPLLAHMVPYVHVEGPHIAPEDGPRGAHPAAHVRPPSLEEFRRWQAASGGLVGMLGALGGFVLPPLFGLIGRATGSPQSAFLALLVPTVASLAWLHAAVMAANAKERGAKRIAPLHAVQRAL